jgi:hypothetical protein
VAFPVPVPGLVIRYSYLWRAEHKRGQEEGVKDRPCAIIMTITAEDEGPTVLVLPVTHTPPSNPQFAIEIPALVKRRLGLDDARSWVVLTEAKRFVWPGPDLRPTKAGDASSIAYGPLPYKFFEQIRLGFIQALKDRRPHAVPRTE